MHLTTTPRPRHARTRVVPGLGAKAVQRCAFPCRPASRRQPLAGDQVETSGLPVVSTIGGTSRPPIRPGHGGPCGSNHAGSPPAAPATSVTMAIPRCLASAAPAARPSSHGKEAAQACPRAGKPAPGPVSRGPFPPDQCRPPRCLNRPPKTDQGAAGPSHPAVNRRSIADLTGLHCRDP